MIRSSRLIWDILAGISTIPLLVGVLHKFEVLSLSSPELKFMIYMSVLISVVLGIHAIRVRQTHLVAWIIGFFFVGFVINPIYCMVRRSA